ncbi:MAG TPA: PKD domain-containing protein [Edaphocola sp.]|nr:PKD domain-containing protein [Edaphocola sp.]
MRIASKIIFLFISFLILGVQAFSSHIFGGDIVYRCKGNNIYEFTFSLYQDCLSGEPDAINQDNPAFFSIFDANTYFEVAGGSTGLAISSDIIPAGFSNECINNLPQTCLRKTIFKFTVNLPPNSAGYIFTYQRCCRNQTINNIYAPGQTGATFTALIPPFTSGQCANNSAVFNNNPPQIICVDNPFSFDFSASDMDGDSLSYELCAAYIGGSTSDPLPGSNFGNSGPIQPPPYTEVSYIPPFSATYPTPSSPAFAIDPITGFLTGTPTQIGRYVFTICCNEWRNGQIINTLKRDLQFVVTNCSKAVIANMPSYSFEPDVYIAKCDSNFTVKFENTSVGGINYFWDFGVTNSIADTSQNFEPSFTYPDTGTYDVKLVVNRGSTCSDSIVRKVKIYPILKADFGIDGKFCKGETIYFSDQSKVTYPSIFSREWTFSDQTQDTGMNVSHVFDPNKENFSVKLVVKSTKGCMDSITRKVYIPYFNPSAGNDTAVIVNHTFNMNGSGGAVYQWTPPDFLSNSTDPQSAITIPNLGIYKYNLYVEDINGCSGNDSVTIIVADKPKFIVPSGFSPNGDGINDVVAPISVGFPNLIFFRIYNRWGNLVYQMYSYRGAGWDGTFKGKKADQGVYFWEAKVYNLEGKTEFFKGDISLIR